MLKTIALFVIFFILFFCRINICKYIINKINWDYKNNGCRSTCIIETEKTLEEAFDRAKIFIPGAGTAISVKYQLHEDFWQENKADKSSIFIHLIYK